MGITERSKDFLRELRRLYKSKQEPVHYEEIARSLGVSKWTAYDMLKKLVSNGLARSEYVVNGEARAAGRSLVVFVPRDEKIVSRQSSLAAESGEGWTEFKTRLSALLKEFDSSGNWSMLKPLVDQLSRIEKPFTYCSYTVVLLLACARLIGTEGLRAISGIISTVGEPGIALTLLAGGVLGVLLAQTKRYVDASALITSCIEKYQQYVNRISDEDRRLLLDFVKEMVSQHV